MGLIDIVKRALGGGGSKLENEIGGAMKGAASGAMYGNPIGGAVSGALAGHPLLQTFLPMLLSGGTFGLGGLLKRFRDKGHTKQADSWVGTGPNETISPQQVQDTLGRDEINKIANDSGLTTDQVTAGLASSLPGLVDHLTPGGKMPTEPELVELLKSVDPSKIQAS